MFEPIGSASGEGVMAQRIGSVEQLEEMLSEPSGAAVRAVSALSGDIVILGAAGKMGPTLAMMAKKASDRAGGKRKVIGVSRFSGPREREVLAAAGIETIKADLMDPAQLAKLPEAPNVVFMAGMKFGSTGNEALTWGMNAYLPGMVAQKYRGSKIVAFSTGNVYGLVPIARGGSIESDAPNPAGEYAMSCLGRERIFEHFSRSLNIPTAIIRLNYASEMRYGVLVDLAKRVWAGDVIDLAMGTFNVIWQGDANAMTLAAFEDASSPPFYLNVAGPELMSVRSVCEFYAAAFGKKVEFTGQESPDALLNNGQMGHAKYGYPRVTVRQMMEWVAEWVKGGGASLGKPTHFEERAGKF